MISTCCPRVAAARLPQAGFTPLFFLSQRPPSWGFYGNRSDRNISSSSELRRFPSSGTGATAEPACRKRPHTNVGGIAERQVVYTNQNAGFAFSRGKSIAPSRGKLAPRGFGRATSRARTTASKRFWSSFDSRRTFYQHLFTAGYLEEVSISASRREGERAIGKFPTSVENGFGWRSGSRTGTFSSAP
jgi:hypothetical protein